MSAVHPDLQSYLSERTVAKRRSLLIFSMLGWLTAETGLIPAKIQAIGVEFSAVSQAKYLFFLLLITAYFAAMFIAYALSDFLQWIYAHNLKRQESELGIHAIEAVSNGEESKVKAELIRLSLLRPSRLMPFGALVGPAMLLRIALERVLPIALAGWSIYALLRAGAGA